jgi:hypothetical protein
LNYYYNLAVINNIFQCLNVAFIQRERETEKNNHNNNN